MTAVSILYSDADTSEREAAPGAPDFFGDLNLGPVVSGILAGRETHNLQGYFYRTPTDSKDVVLRQDVMEDLDREAIEAAVRDFCVAMAGVREYLATAERMRHPLQKGRWHLDAAALYCASVKRLPTALREQSPASEGLRQIEAHFAQYVKSTEFERLAASVEQVENALAAVRYNLGINGSRVDLLPSEQASDYSEEIESLFARFQQNDASDFPFGSVASLEMNQVEERILDLVAEQQPEAFALLQQFGLVHATFTAALARRFDREAQFFLAYMDYIGPLKKLGLPFCRPRIETSSKAVAAVASFDIALAKTLAPKNRRPVANDFELMEDERLIVVSGPNQGGKTTFARMFGQLHYLGSLGLPVPGERATLFLFDKIFTHFERGENTTDLRGKLEDDLIRIHTILERATGRSIVIMNEIFTSTTLDDAVELSRLVLRRLRSIDTLGVWVTFVEAVASGPGIVSMISTVDPEKPSERTFRIVRAAASGMSDAIAIARRHGLTRDLLEERLRA